MHLNLQSRTARRLGIAGLALLAVLAAALLTAWSGLYNISATKGHWPPIKWFLEFGMQNSVETHAMGIREPSGFDDDQVTLGAAHYHGACVACHGAPGIPIGATALRMLPPPPDLSSQVSGWRDRELFWIVKNGIKYTAMPGWVSQQRDDEVWAIVAFLKRYPTLDAQAYRRLALGQLQIPAQGGAQVATAGAGAADGAGACARCHGSGTQGPSSKLVPTLHGQPKEFLVNALEQFASGVRPSGIMQPLAAELTSGAIAGVAAYYAALPPPSGQITGSDAQVIARGRALAETGDQAAKLPACAGCHGAAALPAFPRLAGQNAPYVRMRLRLWKEGLSADSTTAAVMAPIARALTDAQIDDLSAYYASLRSSAAARP
jgi:cytochrome c553